MTPQTGIIYSFIFIVSDSLLNINIKLFCIIDGIEDHGTTYYAPDIQREYMTIRFYICSHNNFILRDMGNNGIVVGEEGLTISGVSAVTADSVGQGNIGIHRDGLAYPDVVNFITGFGTVAKSIVRV